MSAVVSTVTGVNDAFNVFKRMVKGLPNEWRTVSPRGIETIEWKGLFVTEYTKPMERVLFDPLRDANPFFHFFEALWILNGSQDVAYLEQFNSNIANYSDDGEVFHAPYGYRLRNAAPLTVIDTTYGIDQLKLAVEMLSKDRDTRQVVLSIWDVRKDLNTVTKDLPCNDMIFLKIRDGKLNITVLCRSNDAVWGAYGANVVQFSTLQQFIAEAVGVSVGTYCQVSDSMHIYTQNEAWAKCKDTECEDPYLSGKVWPCAMISLPELDETVATPKPAHIRWLAQLSRFITEFNMDKPMPDGMDPYFTSIAEPLMRAWHQFKNVDRTDNAHIAAALKEVAWCNATDWKLACEEWLKRRIK